MISFAKKGRGGALRFGGRRGGRGAPGVRAAAGVLASAGVLAGAGLVAGAVLLLVPGALEAQGQTAPATDAAARQMRHFWHVFAAYAVAWVLVFGWTVSIARRMRRVEARLSGR
jgi:CcmD family protein